MEDFVNRVIEGDCLMVLPKLATNSVDMILCDLPYGVTQNSWDLKIINLEQLWFEYLRIIKPNGVIALTSQGKFTGQLICSNLNWFKYKIVWIKSNSTNFLNANKQPLRRHEDICIFYKEQPTYHPQKIDGKPYNWGIRKDNSSGNYGHYNARHCENKSGKRFPYDILFHEEEIIDYLSCKTAISDGAHHPTQKPVALGRWLIRTFTDPGEVILDNACGSGSFLISAIKEQRKFIGIEKNENTYHFGKKVDLIAVCERRIKDAQLESNNLFSPLI